MVAENILIITDIGSDPEQSCDYSWLSAIQLGREIDSGGMSKIYEVTGVPFQDGLIAKMATLSGLLPKELVSAFPTLASADFTQDVIPLDVDNLIEWDETTDGQIHAGIFSKLAGRFPDSPAAFRAFVEAITLHRLAHRYPEFAAHMTRAHGLVLIRNAVGEYHPTIIMDKVTRIEGDTPVIARSVRHILNDIHNEPHLLRRRGRAIRLLSHLDKVGAMLDELGVKMPITHRDIKPSNLLLRNEYTDELPPVDVLPYLEEDYPEEQLVVADWGTALTKNDTLGKSALGTPEYAAPEQLSYSDRAVPASDQYPLGIIIAEAIGAAKAVTDFATGKSTVAKLLHKLNNPTYHRSLPLWIVDQMGVELPRAIRIADFIRVSGHKDPAKRFRRNTDLTRPIISLLLGEDEYMFRGLEGTEISEYDESDFTFDNSPHLFMRKRSTLAIPKTTDEPENGVLTLIT